MRSWHSVTWFALLTSACPKREPAGDGAVSESSIVDATTEAALDSAAADSDPPPYEDARYEGGFGPFVGEWSGLPGIGCPILVAKDPAAVPPMNWTSCDGVAGCKIARPFWTKDPGWRLGLDIHPVRRVGETAYLGVFRSWPRSTTAGDSHYSMYTVERIDGAVVFASGSPKQDNPCRGMGFVRFSKLGFIGGGVGPKLGKHLLIASAPWSEPGAAKGVLMPFVDVLPGGIISARNWELSDSRLILELVGPLTIGMLDPWKPKSFNTIGGPDVIHAISPKPTIGGALAPDDFVVSTLYFISDDAKFEPVVEIANPWEGMESAVDATNGAFTWIEGIFKEGPEGPGRYDLQLWVSPYARNKAEAKPRKVAPLPRRPRGGMVFENGLVLNTFGDDGAIARLVRVSDGKGWTIKPPPGMSWVRPVWVDDNEVFISADDKSGGSVTGIVRIRRDTLGAPDGP